MTEGTKQQRWNAAVEKLHAAAAEAEALCEEWREWRDRIPENLDDSPLAEALDEMIDTAEEFRRAEATAQIRGLVELDAGGTANITVTMHAFTRGDWYDDDNSNVMHRAIREKFAQLIPEPHAVIGYALLRADDRVTDRVKYNRPNERRIS